MTSIVLPGQYSEGRRGFEIILPSSETGGVFAVVETLFPANSSGPPMHVHTRSDETYYILAGVLLMWVEDKVVEVPAGGLVHISPNTKHTYATPPDTDARFLTLHNPGGYEMYHPTALQAEKDKGGPLDPNDLLAIAANFDWAFAGPQLLPTGVLKTGSDLDGLVQPVA